MTIAARAVVAMLTAMGTLLPLNTAFTAPKIQGAMVTGSVTSQPIGHYEFCRLYKDECNVRSRDAAPPRVTDRGWEIVREINASVNAAITPATDQEVFGREENWAYPVDAGDCEDFVLLKRRKLIEAGFTEANLLITVVRKPDGEGHAILTLRSTQGDYILDNLFDEVKPWFETPYTFLKRQASFDTGRWVTIEDGRDVLVGAVQ